MASRRRKRRGAKPKKLGRLFAYIGLGLLGLFVVVGFCLYLWLRSYLHSDRFRHMLGEEVSEVLDASGEFEEFRWTGTTAFTNSFKAQGYPDAGFSKIRADSIEARINFGAVRRRVWEIANIDIDRVNVLLDQENRIPRPVMIEDETGDDSSGGGGGFFRSLVPNRVELKRLGVAELNFDLLTGDERIFGRGSRVEVKPTGNSEVFRVNVSGGDVTVPAQLQLGASDDEAAVTKLEVTDIDARVGGGKAIIDQGAFRFHEVAMLGVSGDVQFGEGGDPKLNLQARVRDLPAAKVLPEDWAKKLKGTVEADIDVTGTPGGEGAIVLEGDVRLKGGVLEAMPVLDRIDAMLGSSRFRMLSFNDFQFHFVREGDTTKLTDYFALAAGATCLKGHALLPDGGRPSGRYMIGVTPNTIQWLPLFKKAIIEGVFKYGRDEAFGIVFGDAASGIEKPPEGFRWAVANIVPGVADPYTADLREQFIRAGGLAIWAELLGVPEKGLEALNLLANTAREKGIDVVTVLAEGKREDESIFATDNLIRAASELGVSDGMTKILEGVVDGVGEIPGTLFEAGTGLLNGLLP